MFGGQRGLSVFSPVLVALAGVSQIVRVNHTTPKFSLITCLAMMERD